MLEPIIHSLINQPTQWKQTTEHLYNVTAAGFAPDNGVKIYIENGHKEYMILQPLRIKLTYFDRLRLHRTIKKWQKKMLVIAARKVNAQFMKDNASRNRLNRGNIPMATHLMGRVDFADVRGDDGGRQVEAQQAMQRANGF